MKLSRLLGLLFVSLFLAACWLSTLPGAEDPWDENKIVVSDSGVSLDNGGSSMDNDDGGPVTIIIMGGPGFSKIFDLQIVTLRDFGSDVKKNEIQHSSIVEVKEPRVVLPRGELSKAGK